MGLLIAYEVIVIPYIIAYHVPPVGVAMMFDVFTVFAYVIDIFLRYQTHHIIADVGRGGCVWRTLNRFVHYSNILILKCAFKTLF